MKRVAGSREFLATRLHWASVNRPARPASLLSPNQARSSAPLNGLVSLCFVGGAAVNARERCYPVRAFKTLVDARHRGANTRAPQSQPLFRLSSHEGNAWRHRMRFDSRCPLTYYEIACEARLIQVRTKSQTSSNKGHLRRSAGSPVRFERVRESEGAGLTAPSNLTGSCATMN